LASGSAEATPVIGRVSPAASNADKTRLLDKRILLDEGLYNWTSELIVSEILAVICRRSMPAQKQLIANRRNNEVRENLLQFLSRPGIYAVVSSQDRGFAR
jgi:hypothetical protein